MAREHARLLLRINQDEDFTALGPLQQWLYLRIIALPSLNNAGVFDVSVKKLVRLAAGLERAQIEGLLEDLHAAGFLVLDDDLDEALVRSYMRNDGAPRQPKLMIAAARAARQASSPLVRTALATELARMLPEIANEDAAREGRNALSALDSTCAAATRPDRTTPDSMGTGYPTTYPSQETHTREPNPEAHTLGDVEGEGGPADNEDSRNVGTHLRSDNGTSESEDDSESPDDGQDKPGAREDVDELCRHLVERMVANGIKRPRVTKTWHKDARLLLDTDGRDVTKAHRLIDWCHDHHWWRSRIHSMGSFRSSFDAMRLQANAQYERKAGGTGTRASTSDNAAAAVQSLRRNPRPDAPGQQAALPEAGSF